MVKPGRRIASILYCVAAASLSATLLAQSAIFTEYTLPIPKSGPYAIVAGPDWALTTAGSLTQFPADSDA